MFQAQSSVSPEVPTYKLHVDEEFLPFPDNSVDLFISSLRYAGTSKKKHISVPVPSVLLLIIN